MNDFIAEKPFDPKTHSLEQLAMQCWDQVVLASRTLEHPWKLAAFATLNARRPAVRMLVLREAAVTQRTLFFHTDARSSKIEQLTQNSATSVLFWDPQRRVQLIVEGESRVLDDQNEVESHWTASTHTSRRAYLGACPPGSVANQPFVNFPEKLTSRPPTEEESLPGLKNFAVITTQIYQMDLLILQQSDNVRALWRWNNQRWSGEWVAP